MPSNDFIDIVKRFLLLSSHTAQAIRADSNPILLQQASSFYVTSNISTPAIVVPAAARAARRGK
ncbi:hypothetical protein SAMN05216309_12221 [Nitrosomonas europaea]|nr:hypothetical protein SAMN05216310_12121 [Nitrosomonas europaea]SET16440.1 hypothetical protein SAMN05216309_12221 [Nitrosomonas europaea]SJZ65531.1 hypothetical protein SAMN02745113_01533 [Nitrosomonas europaea]